MRKDYECIAEFFYERASNRVRLQIEEEGLRHIDIIYTDTKQLSRIINNKRKRNNPFLINDSALISSFHDEDEYGLVPKLRFESKSEVLWGNEQEIRTYIRDLFMLLWNEVCINRKRINSELYLCDYIPYAKYSAYWKIIFESDTTNDIRFSFVKNSEIPMLSSGIENLNYTRNSDEEYNNRMLNFPAMFFGIKEDTVIENIDSARDSAIEFLYNRCKEEFFNTFKEFAEDNDSFHMLNNIIKKDLIEKRFLPMMEKYRPDKSSLGLRVKNLIFEDLSYRAAIYCNRRIDKSDYRKKLIDASDEYISKLEDIQKL